MIISIIVGVICFLLPSWLLYQMFCVYKVFDSCPDFIRFIFHNKLFFMVHVLLLIYSIIVGMKFYESNRYTNHNAILENRHNAIMGYIGDTQAITHRFTK